MSTDYVAAHLDEKSIRVIDVDEDTTVYDTEYAHEGEKLEHLGERLAVLDNDGRSVATVEVTQVDVLHPLRCPGSSWKRRGPGR